jgi:ribosomal protein L11 methyltransferase
VPHGVIPIKIEAGLAFGTGHHETTALCLGALSDLARRRSFNNVLDLGTGTGLLAIGAAKLWKRRVLASDIDPSLSKSPAKMPAPMAWRLWWLPSLPMA